MLSFEDHIKNVCKVSFFHLRNIARLGSSLSTTDAEKLTHAFISSRLGYCNALFAGISSKVINRLQYVQNSAAGILTKTKKHEHISPVLTSVHWLPVKYMIDFKVLLLTYKSVHSQGPACLRDLLQYHIAKRKLRSGNSVVLSVPRTRLHTVAFCSLAPCLWNALPGYLTNCDSVDVFKSNLKTSFDWLPVNDLLFLLFVY